MPHWTLAVLAAILGLILGLRAFKALRSRPAKGVRPVRPNGPKLLPHFLLPHCYGLTTTVTVRASVRKSSARHESVWKSRPEHEDGTPMLRCGAVWNDGWEMKMIFCKEEPT